MQKKAAKRFIGTLSVCFRAFIVAAVIITQCGCTDRSAPVSGEGYYLDTICRITIYDLPGKGERAKREVIDSMFAECARYESLLSATREESEIWRINHAEGRPVPCGAETMELMEKAAVYSDISGGKFDIAVGALTAQWDFHASDPQVPDRETIAGLIPVSGMDMVEISADTGTVQLKNAQTQLDPGGIAKGYIADRIREGLLAQNVRSAIIDLGGNIVCIGTKPDGSGSVPFRIGIELPFSDRTEVAGVVEAADACIVTSGIYERCFMKDGVLYHHILDPETGMPADSDIISATVTGPAGTACDCDALSTTCFLLGEEEGLRLICSMDGFEAMLIRPDGSRVCTEGFHLADDP